MIESIIELMRQRRRERNSHCLCRFFYDPARVLFFPPCGGHGPGGGQRAARLPKEGGAAAFTLLTQSGRCLFPAACRTQRKRDGSRGQRAVRPSLTSFRRCNYRNVSNRFTADSCGSYGLQGRAHNTSRAEPRGDLSSGQTCHVAQR